MQDTCIYQESTPPAATSKARAINHQSSNFGDERWLSSRSHRIGRMSNYEADDYWNHSPQLVPIYVNYKPSTPPLHLDSYGPVILTKCIYSSITDQTDTGEKRRIGPSPADAYLIRQLAPDLPDIAIAAGERALGSCSPSDGSDVQDTMPGRAQDNSFNPSVQVSVQTDMNEKLDVAAEDVFAATQVASQTLSEACRVKDPVWSGKAFISAPGHEDCRTSRSKSSDERRKESDVTSHERYDYVGPASGVKTCDPDAAAVHGLLNLSRGYPKTNVIVDNHITTSPRFQAHLVSASQRFSPSPLPKFIADSPHHTGSSSSSIHEVHLPSLRTLMVEIDSQENRARSDQSRAETSSHSSVTSPTLVPKLKSRHPQNSFVIATSTRDLMTGEPPDYSNELVMGLSPTSAQSPSGAFIARHGQIASPICHELSPRPAGLPSTTSSRRTSHLELSTTSGTEGSSSGYQLTPSDSHSCHNTPRPSISTDASKNPNTSLTATGTYRCVHTGCNAPPYQTQYLLK